MYTAYLYLISMEKTTFHQFDTFEKLIWVWLIQNVPYQKEVNFNSLSIISRAFGYCETKVDCSFYSERRLKPIKKVRGMFGPYIKLLSRFFPKSKSC